MSSKESGLLCPSLGLGPKNQKTLSLSLSQRSLVSVLFSVLTKWSPYFYIDIECIDHSRQSMVQYITSCNLHDLSIHIRQGLSFFWRVENISSSQTVTSLLCYKLGTRYNLVAFTIDTH